MREGGNRRREGGSIEMNGECVGSGGVYHGG